MKMEFIILSSNSHFILLSIRTNKRTESPLGEFHVKNNNYEVVHYSEVKGECSSMGGEPGNVIFPRKEPVIKSGGHKVRNER